MAALTARPISATGSTAPISLLVCMTETRMVSGRIAAATWSGETRPSRSTPRRVTSKPCDSRYFMASRTAGCSICVVIRCFPLLCAANAPPMMAILSDSVPQEVK